MLVEANPRAPPAVCLCAVTFGIVAACPSAARALTGTAELSPSTVAYWGSDDPRTTREVVHRLHLQAGPEEERFNLLLKRTSSDPLTLVLEGPGTLGPDRVIGMTVAAPPQPWPGPDRCGTAGFIDETHAFSVVLPAGAASTVVLTDKTNLTSAPRYPGAFQRRWTAAPLYSEPVPSTIPAPIEFADAPPALAGLAAADLDFLVTDGARSIRASQSLQVPAGRLLTLAGALSPTGAARPVTVRIFDPGQRNARVLATVSTDAVGKFSVRWRPASTGTYELYAEFAGVPEQVEATRSPCHGPLISVVNALTPFIAKRETVSALRRTFGRPYRRATNQTIRCTKRSAATYRCSYRFTVRKTHTGFVTVSSNDRRITATVTRTQRK